MQERSESQKVAQSGQTLKCGTHEYEIKPLPIRKALKWREANIATIEKILSNPEAFTSIEDFERAFTTCPSELNDVVVYYLEIGYDLDEEAVNEIYESATEFEVGLIFQAIMGMSLFPFVTQQATTKLLNDRLQAKAEETPQKPNGKQSERPSTLH